MKLKDYPESAIKHCPSCGEKDLMHVSNVKMRKTKNIDTIILAIISSAIIVLGIICAFSAENMIEELIRELHGNVLEYTRMQQRSQNFFIVGVCGLLLTIIIQLLKNKKTDTLIMTICSKCGKISQQSFRS